MSYIVQTTWELLRTRLLKIVVTSAEVGRWNELRQAPFYRVGCLMRFVGPPTRRSGHAQSIHVHMVGGLVLSYLVAQ